MQRAIHVKVPGSVDWEVCKDAINEDYSAKDVGAASIFQKGTSL